MRWDLGCGGAGILQPRDLRVIDESFALSHQPAFLVRQYCMVVNLKPVRAIILPGKVLLFPRDGADGELLVRCRLCTRGWPLLCLWHSW